MLEIGRFRFPKLLVALLTRWCGKRWIRAAITGTEYSVSLGTHLFHMYKVKREAWNGEYKNGEATERNGIDACASGCHLLLLDFFGHVFLIQFFNRHYIRSFWKVLASTLSITDKNGDRLRATGDRSELKLRVGDCENVNYHVWPDDK